MSKSTSKIISLVLCPRCEGDGEEPGAPIADEGVWLCNCCQGKGWVSPKVFAQYKEDEELSS